MKDRAAEYKQKKYNTNGYLPHNNVPKYRPHSVCVTTYFKVNPFSVMSGQPVLAVRIKCIAHEDNTVPPVHIS